MVEIVAEGGALVGICRKRRSLGRENGETKARFRAENMI
jgi:hypothetical protein